MAKKRTKQPIVPPLTAEYNRARRQLVLWSAILFAWEFIGIDFDKIKKVQGAIGAFADSLKSPQAVPLILLILVVYFFYRCIIEWLQCDHKRRLEKASQIDFVVSKGIGIIAICLFLIQTLFNINVAEGSFTHGFKSGLIVVLLYYLSGSIDSEIWKIRRGEKSISVSTVLYLLIMIIIVVFMMIIISLNIKNLFPDTHLNNPYLVFIVILITMVALSILGNTLLKTNFLKKLKNKVDSLNP